MVRHVESVNGVTIVKDVFKPNAVSVNGITLIENAFKPDVNPLSGRSPSKYAVLNSHDTSEAAETTAADALIPRQDKPLPLLMKL